MRDVISHYLNQRAQTDEDFLVLSGDHGYALFDEIRSRFPDQFINTGVTEQAMVGYAAGMAKQGLSTIVYGLAAFIPMRVLEFIKMTVCYENLPVIFLGDGAGVVYTTLGASHQCCEDIAALRSMPNMEIYSPADAQEMKACLASAETSQIPAYIRIGKADKRTIHPSEIALPNGEFIRVRGGNSTGIVATGSMVSTALDIGDKYDLSVYSAPKLTGINFPRVAQQFDGLTQLITMEEHSINGGLGSILAEIIAEMHLRLPLKRIGIKNRFTEKCGSYNSVLREHSLDYESIVRTLQESSLI